MESAATGKQQCCAVVVYSYIVARWAGVVNPPICPIATLGPTQGTGRVPVAVLLLAGGPAVSMVPV